MTQGLHIKNPFFTPISLASIHFITFITEEHLKNRCCIVSSLSLLRGHQVRHVLLLSLGRCLCRWTIIFREYHSSSIQCSSTDRVYMIYFYQNSQFPNHVIIIKTYILLPRAYVTLTDFDYPVEAF